jgi:hypothetical protein
VAVASPVPSRFLGRGTARARPCSTVLGLEIRSTRRSLMIGRWLLLIIRAGASARPADGRNLDILAAGRTVAVVGPDPKTFAPPATAL